MFTVPGSILYLVPYHACATLACHPVYYVTDEHTDAPTDKDIIKEEWRPCRGW